MLLLLYCWNMKVFLFLVLVAAAYSLDIIGPHIRLDEGEKNCDPPNSTWKDEDYLMRICKDGLRCDNGVCRANDNVNDCWSAGTACACYPVYSCGSCCSGGAGCKWAPWAYCNAG